MFSIILDISTFFTYICVNDQNCRKLIKYYYITKGAFPMFGKKADDKIAKKQAEQEAKDKSAMEKFGVDFDSYTSDDIKEKNVASLKEIASSLAGSKMYSFGSLLSGNSNETFALEMSRAQVEQNFILMRQNEEIIRLLKQIAEK
jgi:hypothetical protein